MRTFDFSPYTRSTIGFESMFDGLNNLQAPENGNGYPPYDIVRTGERRLPHFARGGGIFAQ